MSEVDTQLTTLTATHSNGLLSKYKSRWSRLHRIGNILTYAYMVAGLGLPAGGTALCAMSIASWLSTATKMGLNRNLVEALFGIIAIPSALLAALWVVMTPLCILVLCYQRRFIALLPLLFCALWFVFTIKATALLGSSYSAVLSMVVFAFGAFFGTKINWSVMAQIRQEPAHCQPKVLGCGASHEKSPALPTESRNFPVS